MNTTVKYIIWTVIIVCITIPQTFAGKKSDGIAQKIKGNQQQKIVDKANRIILIKKPFQRIISLYGAHTENLFCLGLKKEIIGVSLNEAFPSEALQKPGFSYHDDPERFLAAKPDLVLIRPMIDRAYPQLISRLERSGIVVVSLQPRNIHEVYQYWQVLGKLTGKTARAQRMIHNFSDAVKKIETLSLSIDSPKQVYFEAIHRKMKTFAPKAMPIFLLETVGGINAASDAKTVRNTNIAYYSKERLLAKGAKIDIYLAQFGAMNRPDLQDIYQESGYQVIQAIKQKQVYLIDEMIVSRPTMRLLNGMLQIGVLLYPDVYCMKGKAIILNALQEFKIDLNQAITPCLSKSADGIW
jgi:iron complex transport system substrate-binding protein